MRFSSVTCNMVLPYYQYGFSLPPTMRSYSTTNAVFPDYLRCCLAPPQMRSSTTTNMFFHHPLQCGFSSPPAMRLFTTTCDLDRRNRQTANSVRTRITRRPNLSWELTSENHSSEIKRFARHGGPDLQDLDKFN